MKAYISGASGFLGQRIAKHFIAQGYSVTLSGKNLEKLEEIRKQLLNSAPQSNLLVEIHLLDFSKPEDISSELKCIDLDSFDWCVNAAGTQGTVSPDLNLTYADYTETLAVNLLSPIELTRYFSQHFLSRKKGCRRRQR